MNSKKISKEFRRAGGRGFVDSQEVGSSMSAMAADMGQND
jgi:hypothetical protein